MAKTILCISSYEKGQEFLRQAKREGWKVLLLTSKSLEYADWPKDHIDTIYYIPDINKEWHMPDVISGVSYLARTEQIDRIVALDDFDVEKARQGYMTVEKGSVTVNGVSLTVVNSKDDSFQVAIIPYTYEHTNFHTFRVGTVINLEFDIIGKYLSRLANYK
jgi:ABC-type branched-subunit amino acid transport system substrate-binding protein